MEHLARDASDFPTAKLTVSVLTRMVLTWGGPDIMPMSNSTQVSPVPNGEVKHKLQGFDRFMITRFSPLCWAIPSHSNFDTKDAQAKQVLTEAAALQKAIYSKSGQEYLTYLRTVELRSMGMDSGSIETYINSLSSMDLKGFQQYFKVRSLSAVPFPLAKRWLGSCVTECRLIPSISQQLI